METYLEIFLKAVKGFDWESVAILATTLTAISAGIEKMFGVKFLGRAVFAAIVKPFQSVLESRRMLTSVVDQLSALSASQERQSVALEEIRAEVRMNGGKYLLRDAVASISSTQRDLASMIDATFQSSPNPSYILDEKGMLENVNTAWLKMTGAVSLDEVRGYGWLKFIPDKDREAMRQQALFDRENPSDYNGPIVFWNPCSGEEIKTTVRSRVIRNSDGTPVKQIGTIDIEEDENKPTQK